MRLQQDHISGSSRFVFYTLPLILAPLALAIFLPPDGSTRAEGMQFIGHFHPLTVHFPIAFFLLVPILELAGLSNRFSQLCMAVEFVLGLGTVSAVPAAILGWCLARSGGYSGPLLTQHMWGGISVAGICWLCWLLRVRAGESGPGAAYMICLVLGVGLVSWTGYRGGQLSLGENHLTEHMPAFLRSTLGIDGSPSSSSNPGPDTFYGARVQPIFAGRCVNCHGASKQKANLRLDTYSALMRGGKDGPVIKAGDASGSDLFRRIALPVGHDDFMPKGGTQPLTPDQIKAIESWIVAGASGTLGVDAIKNGPEPSAADVAPAAVTFDELNPAAVVELRAPIAPAVAQLKKRFPNILDYESRGSANLILNASILGSKFGDGDLEAFAPVADHITFADLSRTAITNHSATNIAVMKQLRVLRLMNTGITDATINQIGNLGELESLNLFGTCITSNALPAIARLPRLKHAYVGQTAIPSRLLIAEPLASKLVF